MGVERYADLLAAWQFVHFSSTIAPFNRIAVLLNAEIYWPRPKRVARRTLHHSHAEQGEGALSSTVCERKFMNQFVVKLSFSLLVAILPRYKPVRSILDRDAEKMSHAAMNIAAITGPITKPLIPKIAMPPRVATSTT